MEAAKDQSILVVCQRYSGDGDNRDSDDVRVRHAIRPHAPSITFLGDCMVGFDIPSLFLGLDAVDCWYLYYYDRQHSSELELVVQRTRVSVSRFLQGCERILSEWKCNRSFSCDPKNGHAFSSILAEFQDKINNCLCLGSIMVLQGSALLGIPSSRERESWRWLAISSGFY